MGLLAHRLLTFGDQSWVAARKGLGPEQRRGSLTCTGAGKRRGDAGLERKAASNICGRSQSWNELRRGLDRGKVALGREQEEATRDLRATDLERRVEDSVDGSSTRLLFFAVSFLNTCILLQRFAGFSIEQY